MPKISLGVKLPLLFILISSLPLLLANLFWFTFSEQSIMRAKADEIKRVATLAARDVENFLITKQISLIIHSQTDAVISQQYDLVTTEFEHFLLQDEDIIELSLLDTRGQEVVKMTRTKVYGEEELSDQSNSTAYKVTTFVGSERYISPVMFDQSGTPMIEIAVPLVFPQEAQSLQDLTTSITGKSRQPGETGGVLRERVTLAHLWKTANSWHIGSHGYVFLVDETGNLLYHPLSNQITPAVDIPAIPAVKRFLTRITTPERFADSSVDEPVIESFNEFGEAALTTHVHIPMTRWGVITQVPIVDVFTLTRPVGLLTLVILLIFFTAVILTSFWFAGRIVSPIEEVHMGSQRIGEGDLSYRLHVTTGDEIEDLGNAFNTMAKSLQKVFAQLTLEKNLMSAERNKLAVIVAGIRDAIIAVNLEQEIVLFNKAAEVLTGITAKEAFGKPIQDVLRFYQGTTEYLPAQYCPTQSDVVEGVVASYQDLRMRSTTGKEAYVHLVSGKIMEGRSINLGCIIALHDVTKEQQLEEMRRDFVSMAAHELRTPLTAMRGYISLLQDETKAEEQKELVTRLIRSCNQLGHLIENLLSVSRIERSVFSLEVSSVAVVDVVTEVAAEFQEQAVQKKQTLTVLPLGTPLPNGLIDRFRIAQVLRNLLVNAMTYTPSGGSITLSVGKKDESFLLVTVADTGCGIPQDAFPHLFTKFFRVQQPKNGALYGTGLGLFISKSIIALHHGTIWVESQVGKGSTFFFTLPIDMPEHRKQLPIQKERGILVNTKDRASL